MRRVCLSWLMVPLVASACDSSEASLPEAVVADSANTRVYSYDVSRGSLPTRWRLGEPDLEIGELQGGDPHYLFSAIVDLVVTDDGSIVVSDGITADLRVFDASGLYLRTIGTRGEGPGEFAAAPTIVGTAGDSLYLFDTRASRITVVRVDGELVETIRIDRGSGGRLTSLLRLTNGTFLARSRLVNPEVSVHGPQLMLDSMVVERISRDGETLDTVGVFPDQERVRMVQARGDALSTIEGDPPFAARTFLRTDGQQALVGWNDAFELAWIGPTHETRLRVAGLDDRSSAREIRTYQEEVVNSRGEAIDPMTRRLYLEYLPERLPAFGDVIVGEAGELWVAMTGFDLSEGLEWLVFSTTVQLEGVAHTPPDFHVRSIANGYVVGVALDGLDVPYVRRYPLLTPTG